MKHLPRKLSVAAVLITLMAVASPFGSVPAMHAQSPVPFNAGEILHYKLLWPSRISLGEAVFRVFASGDQLSFEVTMEAELPTHGISSTFRSTASRADLCSVEFKSTVTEGTKTSEEFVRFDQQSHQATMVARGQSSSSPIPICARDPVTFLYYMRRQIAAGAGIDASTFFLGPDHKLEIKPAGSESISVRGQQQSAGKYLVTYNARNSQKSFDVWITRDARREPVLIRRAFPLAIFSAEIE